MNSFLLTLAFAFVITVIALALLGLSWLFTGKLRIRPGACGRDPTKKQDDQCGNNTSCGLCDHKGESKK